MTFSATNFFGNTHVSFKLPPDFYSSSVFLTRYSATPFRYPYYCEPGDDGHDDEETKGRHHKEKHVFFQALPKLGNPPLPPIRATWSAFFRRQKQRIARITEKSTNDDNDS